MQSVRNDQQEKILTEDDLRVGDKLPWDLYAANGSMLLSRGKEVKSSQQIQQFISHGARYSVKVDPADSSSSATDIPPKKEPPVSFLIIQQLIEQLETTFALLEDEKNKTFANQILRVALDIQAACNECADAIVGSIQLTLDAPHRIEHPLHNAILCEVATRRMGKDPLERLPLIAAALTHDIGMQKIQDQVFSQAEPLTESQRKIIDNHPEVACEMLKQHGVTEKRWLTAVLQHHERLDGSGYPKGISKENLSEDAKLLAITDNYTALIRPRAYRSRILHKEALREMLQNRGSSIDGELARLFINTMGIYSPGSMVKMKSGEIGIVTRLTDAIDKPEVLLITDASEKPVDITKRADTSKESAVISAMVCPHEYEHLLEDPGTIWPMRHPLASRSGHVY